ncbi:MAG: serine protease [Planctomycetes bacterium]|nr:serine protease [Planctomycetota bacterium]
MKPVALAIAFLAPFAVAQAQQDELDKVHVRIAKKVAPATVAVDGGGVRGSGVIIDKSGIILTSPTAVGTSTTRVTVVTKGSRSYTGKVLGRANDRELVVVKIDAAQDLPFLELGDSDAARAGQIAYVFGDSYDSIRADDQAAMSLGVISSVYDLTQRHDKALYTGKVLETSAAVNPSQNGGPLVDREGRLLGLVTLNYDDSKFTGLAVPINTLKPLVEKIRKDYGSAPVVIGPLRPEPAAAPKKPVEPPPAADSGEAWLGLEVKAVAGGVEVTRVARKSPAHKAGLHRGDVVTMIDAAKVASEEALHKAIARKAPEETVRITVQRDGGGIQELTVKLAARPVY